jgi:hypothetical protein
LGRTSRSLPAQRPPLGHTAAVVQTAHRLRGSPGSWSPTSPTSAANMSSSSRSPGSDSTGPSRPCSRIPRTPTAASSLCLAINCCQPPVSCPSATKSCPSGYLLSN